MIIEKNELAVARNNGAAKAGDWRRAAMDEALRCRAAEETPEYILFAILQAWLPGAQVRRFGEEREPTLAALREQLTHWETLIAPIYRDDHETDPLPVCGWWRAMLPSGKPVEIVLSPDGHGYGEWVLACEDAAALEALVRGVFERVRAFTGRCLRYGEGAWHDAPEMVAEVDRTRWDDIVLAPELLGDIRRNIEAFFTQKETFRRLGFAWRRGILLVGPPGTGKTMICKAAASAHPEVPFLYVRDLRSNHDPIRTIFERARQLAPCILAFEDLDGFLNDGNRTTFLNEMDGFKSNDGLLVIASSNHPHKIDEALLKRPSRFDRVYHVGLPAAPERAEHVRRTLARMVLPDGLDVSALAEKLAGRTEGFTPAFLKEAILSALLELVQSGREGDPIALEAAALGQVETLRGYLKKAKNPEKLGDIAPSYGEGVGFGR